MYKYISHHRYLIIGNSNIEVQWQRVYLCVWETSNNYIHILQYFGAIVMSHCSPIIGHDSTGIIGWCESGEGSWIFTGQECLQSYFLLSVLYNGSHDWSLLLISEICGA